MQMAKDGSRKAVEFLFFFFTFIAATTGAAWMLNHDEFMLALIIILLGYLALFLELRYFIKEEEQELHHNFNPRIGNRIWFWSGVVLQVVGVIIMFWFGTFFYGFTLVIGLIGFYLILASIQ